MTEAKIAAEKKRLADYLASLRWVWTYGGCVLAEESKPVHRGKRK